MTRLFRLCPPHAAALYLVLAASMTLSAQGVKPALNSLSPSAAVAGSGPLTVNVNGSGFQPGCSALWNATTLPVSYVSSTLLTMSVPAFLLSAAGTISVSITNPAGAVSNLSVFTISAEQILINTKTLPKAKQGIPYSATLSVTGGISPYTWTTVDALPSGLTLTSVILPL